MLYGSFTRWTILLDVSKSIVNTCSFWIRPGMRAQTLRAWGHAHRAWVTVSLSDRQIGHTESRRRWQRERHCRVGNTFIPACHRCILTLLGITCCQTLFHTLLFVSLQELSIIPSSVFNRIANWYVKLTENLPFGTCFQNWYVSFNYS